MRFAMAGLGRMGLNIVRNALDKGHEVVAFNRSRGPRAKAVRAGALTTGSLEEMISLLGKRRVVWLMVTAGSPVDELLDALIPLLRRGDIIIEGGNSFYEDSRRRYARCRRRGVHFLDCGVSGGVEGARRGACMMLAGDKGAWRSVEPLVRSLCVPDGYAFLGKPGAGHYVKMVHNAIEYGMMGAIAEGINAVRAQQRTFGYDVEEVIRVYNHGSIIESRLLGWLHRAWRKDRELKGIRGMVPMGATEQEMSRLERLSPMPVLHEARLTRERTRKKESFAGKIIAAIRHEFGGHDVRKK